MPFATALRRKPVHLVIAIACFVAPLLLLPAARAENSQEQWRRSELAAGTVVSITTGGDTPVLYAVLARAGVRQSQDDGATWQPRSAGLPGGLLDDISVCALAVDPGNAAVVYAGVSMSGSMSVYRSSDGGLSWVVAAGGFTGAPSCALAVSPGGDTVYAAAGSRLLAGVNKGTAWALQGAWEDGGPAQIIIVSPQDPARLVVLTDKHLYASADAGRTWRAITPPQAAVAPSAIVLAGRSGALVAGAGADLYHTANFGATWSLLAVSPAGSRIQTLLWDAADEAVGFLATEDSVWRTIDGGKSWREMPGIASSAVHGLAQGARGHLFAATETGVWHSRIVLAPPPTATAMATATRTSTASATATQTATSTATATPTATPTATAPAATATATPTTTATEQPTSTATATLLPEMKTPTASPTAPPPAPSPTDTARPSKPDPTATPEPTPPPTRTPEPTKTPTRPIR